MGTQTQVGILRSGDGSLWDVYGRDSYTCIHQAKTVRGALHSAKLALTDEPAWRVFIGQFEGHTYPIIVKSLYHKPRLIPGIETSGPCVAKGALDKVWPIFESYVRML